MTHVAFQENGPTLCDEFDYIVVGSGAGGASVAVELARGGANVGIVESGPWRDPEDYPSSMYGAFRDIFDNFGQNLTRGRAMWPVVQGQVVGGTTVMNSAIIVRTPADIFSRWKTQFGVGGTEMAEAVWGIQDQIEHELSVTVTPDDVLGGSCKRAHAADKLLDVGGHTIQRSVKDCKGAGQCLQGCREGSKRSLNLTYVPEVRTLGGTVFSCALARRVQHKQGKAYGVEGYFQHPQTKKRGANFRLIAKKAVILAASATHTPALMLRSGIKMQALGHFFRAHPGSSILGCYRDRVDMQTGATQGWASTKLRLNPGLKLETLSLPLELIAGRVPGAGATLARNVVDYPYLASWIAAINGETSGQIKIGVFGSAPIVYYSITRADMERLRAGAVLLAKMHFEAGARYVITGVHSLPGKISRDQLNLLENAPADSRCWTGILTHLFGGAVMGKDPTHSVCDGNGKVHGCENLYIADAAAFPSTLGVNPQHSIMAIGRLRGRQLLERQ